MANEAEILPLIFSNAEKLGIVSILLVIVILQFYQSNTTQKALIKILQELKHANDLITEEVKEIKHDIANIKLEIAQNCKGAQRYFMDIKRDQPLNEPPRDY